MGRKPLHLFVVTLILIMGLAAGLVTATPTEAAAVAQCNNDTASNVGGQGMACTVTVANYLNANGTMATSPPSTMSVVRCVGAAGPVGAGAGTCTTTLSILTEPLTLVQQCNGSSNGGGGVLICHVVIVNHWISGGPTPTAAKVYQCVGSAVPNICTPVNTPGVTSVTAATVGQCNGSGNGGTSVSFICSVTVGSTESAGIDTHVDQCNGSANGGGSLVLCTASVTNLVTATPTATASPTATSSPTASPTATVTSTPTATASPSPTATATGTPTTTPTASPSPTATATATPTGTATATPTSSPTPTVTATATSTATATATPTQNGPDLTVSKRLKPGQPANEAGGYIYYLITVRNVGDRVAVGPVTLLDTPPTGTSIRSWGIISGSGRCSIDGANRLVCDLGRNWAPGEVKVVEAVVRVPNGGALTNRADVDPYNRVVETNENNNTSVFIVIVP